MGKGEGRFEVPCRGQKIITSGRTTQETGKDESQELSDNRDFTCIIVIDGEGTGEDQCQSPRLCHQGGTAKKYNRMSKVGTGDVHRARHHKSTVEKY